jgi:hypothetical protein
MLVKKQQKRNLKMSSKPACNPNTVTGQNRVIRKKGDLNGAGKGDWMRISNRDEQYKKNYDKIDWSK